MENQFTKFMSKTKIVMIMGVAFGYLAYKAINTLQNRVANLEKTVKELNDWKENHSQVINFGAVPPDLRATVTPQTQVVNLTDPIQ